MASRRPRSSCRCARSSLLLFLSTILPTPSFAQLTSSLPASTQSLTTLLTSTTPPVASTTPSQSATLTQSRPTTVPRVPRSAPSGDSHVADYYFLIVAAVAAVVCCAILYISRRKRRKAALARSDGQRALARDVEGWRSRFGVGRVSGSSNGIHDIGREEGLDERGEAPPPYAPVSKPPSIGSEEIRRPSLSHAPEGVVELRRMSGEAKPPGYHEHPNRMSEEGSAGITRPDTAVTASERVGSMRRLVSNTGSSFYA